MGIRVLLVEFVNADQLPGRVDFWFPFIRGYLHEQKVPTKWLRFGVSTTNLLLHGRDQITLPQADFARLLDAVKDFTPSHLLLTDTLYERQRDELARTVPGVVIESRRDVSFQGPPGIRPFEGLRELDRPGFVPLYDWVPANEASLDPEVDNIYFAQSLGCGHKLRLNRNPLYRDIGDPRVQNAFGCTFCGNPTLAPESTEVATGRPTPLAWIDKQIEGLERTLALAGRLPHGVMLQSLETRELLERCVRGIEAIGDAGPRQVMIACRTDRVGALARVLRDHFAQSPDSKTRFGVCSSGIESFESADLLRFNKGLTPLDGLTAINELRQLAADAPDRFWYTGLSFILFTPWTTLQGLHLNLGLVRLLGLTGREAGNLFQGRLRLHPWLPITCLAERHGLVRDVEQDGALRMNRRKLFEQERPWRFVDNRLHPLSRIVLRYDLLETALADDLAKEVEGSLDDFEPSWRDTRDAICQDHVLSMIDVARSDHGKLTESSLLERAKAVMQAQRQERQTPQPLRFRLGDDQVDVDELVRRLGPLVGSQSKSVLSVEKVLPSEARQWLLEGRQRGLAVAWMPNPNDQVGTLLCSRSPTALAHASALHDQAGNADDAARRRAIVALGDLYGYPTCCVNAYADDPVVQRLPLGWAVLARRTREPHAVVNLLDPLTVPALGFVPCSLHCPSAAARLDAWLSAIGARFGPWLEADLVRVAELDPTANGCADGQLALLRRLAWDDGSLRYEVVRGGRESRLSRRLESGDRLTMVPGQLRIERAGEVIDWMTGSHGVFFADHCWHGAFWHELALGVSKRALVGRVDSQAAPWAAKTSRAGEGPSATLGARARTAWVTTVLRRVSDRIHERTGWKIEEVRADKDETDVVFWSREGSMVLWVLRSSSATRAFCRGPHWAVGYRGAERLSPSAESAISLVHKSLEKASTLVPHRVPA